jgi:hypothetical protein
LSAFAGAQIAGPLTQASQSKHKAGGVSMKTWSKHVSVCVVSIAVTLCAIRLNGQALTPLYGVTITDPWSPPDIVAALAALPHRPTARIVFDEWVAAWKYLDPVAALRVPADLMGEILDSAYVRQYSVAQYENRVNDYLNTLGQSVAIWEICNECNGEWLGRTPDVVTKMTFGYDSVKLRHLPAALTLYYNQDCWSQPSHEMFRWAAANVPARIKQGLDYVLISYYEDDCNGLQPNWPAVFNQLGAMFPNSKIGFGETGTTNPASKEEFIDRYYRMQIDHPRYIGGYFWWYFNEDMVPETKPLWAVLSGAMQ